MLMLLLQAGVFFNEVDLPGSEVKYVPRSVQIDLESGVCDRVRPTNPLTLMSNC